MRLGKEAGRCVVLLLSLSFLFAAIAPLQAFAQSEQASSADIRPFIDRAEESYRLGAEALAKGDRALARKMFDQAVDSILNSGINLRANAGLQGYYTDLLNRIHKHGARASGEHPDEPAEAAEPSTLDEFSKIKESDLATETPEGIKIFGSYDFDFSVAPPVFQFINYFVAGRGRSTMETGLQRSGRYRQMAERIFREERVPLDLIWLAQAESVWKPKALSHAAAKGIWQFIPSTGSQYGLAQTAWVDDRSHPEKSTRAAARYLRFLHDNFAGDWLLAMAAYNSGENRVEKTIARCGYADFWEIHRRGLLPAETRNYVPIILAIMIISKNQQRYGFNVKPDLPLQHDTFELPGQTDLKVVADLLNVPFDVVQEMNPELRRGVSPPGSRYTIKLPKGMKRQFEVAYASLPEDQRVRKIVIPREEIAEASQPAYRTKLSSYRVKRGDTLAALARRHGVSIQELARINRISARGDLRKGQIVRIPTTLRASRGKASRVERGAAKARASRYVEKRATRSRLSAKGKRQAVRESRKKSSNSKKAADRSRAKRRR